jgi:cytochrome c-type biogenesis protein CcmF
VYVSLLGYEDTGSKVTVQAQLNPLVGWIWIGGGVLTVGGLVALWPTRRARSKRREITEVAEVAAGPPAGAAE